MVAAIGMSTGRCLRHQDQFKEGSYDLLRKNCRSLREAKLVAGWKVLHI